jgi:hypothetical protein
MAAVRLRGSRGTADALGLVLMTPFVIAVAVTVVHLGLAVDRGAVARSSAALAAQTAALERRTSDAEGVSSAAVLAMVEPAGTCPSPQVIVDLSDHRPGGAVSAEVRCGSAIGRSVAVVDRFRWSRP